MAGVDLPGISNITISGRIGSGSTTLAKALSKKFDWKHIEGGDVFWEQVRSRLNLDSKDTNLRPDKEDQDFDAQLKKMLADDKNLILETKLAGFNAQGIPGVFKILVVCEDEEGNDKIDIRIDRLLNREDLTVTQAKVEAVERENNDLEKWRKLYANGDPNWHYWDPKYYDLVINTYSHNQDQTLALAVKAIGLS